MSELAVRWVTFAQAVTITGRSRRTINRWAHERRIQVLTVNGQRHIRELTLLRVEAATRTPGPRLPLDDLTPLAHPHSQ